MDRKYIIPFLILISAIMFQFILSNKAVYIPKIVWSYWDKQPPPSVVAIVENNRNVLTDWEFNFLDEISVKKFISESEFPLEYNALSSQHKADYIRLVLLKKYGGLWLDASIQVYQPEMINRMHLEAIQKRAKLVGFSLYEPQEEYIENWFIMAPKSSSIIQYWFQEYDFAVKIGFQEYKRKIFRDGYKISEKIYKENDNEVYLTQHACLQIVRQKNIFGKHNVLLYKAEDSMFKIHEDCDWEVNCIKNRVKDPMIGRRVPFIKLRGCDRD